MKHGSTALAGLDVPSDDLHLEWIGSCRRWKREGMELQIVHMVEEAKVTVNRS